MSSARRSQGKWTGIADGLAFLHSRMRENRCGPVLTAAVGGE